MEHEIYKIATRDQWEQAQRAGVFEGAPIDLQDGYIHFSTLTQVRETAAKHFSGQDDLFLLTVDAANLGAALKYEVSRGGALFPHLYAQLALDSVKRIDPLVLSAEGDHVFPDHLVGKL